MDDRENEIQKLCQGVLNATPARYFNPNGADETTCPFCEGIDYSNGCNADMQDTKHLGIYKLVKVN